VGLAEGARTAEALADLVGAGKSQIQARIPVTGLMTGPTSGTIRVVIFTKRKMASRADLKRGWLAAGAAGSLLVVLLLGAGCDRLGITAGDVISDLPENFQETLGTARIMPLDISGGSIEKEGGGKVGTLRFVRKSSTQDPYCGATLRLIPEKAEGRSEYRKFLLPRTIVEYAAPYPAAVTVELGDAAEEIRCIAPKGAHYIGLLPKFKQEWLVKIGQGGVADQVARVSAVWSRMRSEDLKVGGNLFVSSIYHYPRENFIPLFVSMVNPLESALPKIEAGGGGEGVERWVEGVLLQRIFPRVTKPKFVPGEDGRGWILLRPLGGILGDKDVSEIEAGILLASMAVRDGIPCWFAIFSDTVFLFLGGEPGGDGSYAFSIRKYLNGAGGGGFYEFMNESRSHYLGEATTKGEPKFVDAGDYRLFYPIPPTKSAEAGGGKSKSKGGAGGNPFDQPRL
jgi:hypothetical protein